MLHNAGLDITIFFYVRISLHSGFRLQAGIFASLSFCCKGIIKKGGLTV